MHHQFGHFNHHMHDDATLAKAKITVHTYEPKPYDEPTNGPALSRIHVEESFSGDIEANGVVEFLQAGNADGSASFVGIERITGKIGGKEGTFLLQDSGTVKDNIVTGWWFVVPGSGTGELKDLHGKGGFKANLGEGADVELYYWFESSDETAKTEDEATSTDEA